MAFSGQNRKFKRFFRPKTGDLPKKKKKKKGLHQNTTAFSGRKQKLKRFFRPETATFPPNSHHSNLDWGMPKSRIVEGDAHFQEKIQWGARNKSGGGGQKQK